PADHEGLELHRAPLSPATRNPRWHMGISQGAARELRRDMTVRRELRHGDNEGCSYLRTGWTGGPQDREPPGPRASAAGGSDPGQSVRAKPLGAVHPAGS